jgi:Tat protein translocase TatB subunit
VLNVGTPELLVIMVVALLVLGPEKLPEVARKVGNVVGELRRMSAGFQAEMRDALQEPLNLPPVEPESTPAAGPDVEAEPAPDASPTPVEPDAGDETRPD